MGEDARHRQQAGELATCQNAHPEAIAALTKGLALLATLPDAPKRMQQELVLQLALGQLLMAAKSMLSLEVGQALSRAHALCHQAGEPEAGLQAKSLKLRAALSRSRLWSQQGKRDNARRLFAEVYAWFTEGLDTPDLQEAQALVAELS